jgi:shikimate dehydrogenase
LTEKVEADARLVVWRGGFKVPEAPTSSSTRRRSAFIPTSTARIALDTATLKPSMIVADVIPNPPRTRLVRDAEASAAK